MIKQNLRQILFLSLFFLWNCGGDKKQEDSPAPQRGTEAGTGPVDPQAFPQLVCPAGQAPDASGKCMDVPRCEADQDLVGAGCLAKCKDHQTRNGKVCEDKPCDKANEERIQGKCEPKCPVHQTRNTNFVCEDKVCPATQKLNTVDGKCEDLCVKPKIFDGTGGCVDSEALVQSKITSLKSQNPYPNAPFYNQAFHKFVDKLASKAVLATEISAKDILNGNQGVLNVAGTIKSELGKSLKEGGSLDELKFIREFDSALTSGSLVGEFQGLCFDNAPNYDATKCVSLVSGYLDTALDLANK